VDYIIGGRPFAVRLKRHYVYDLKSDSQVDSGEFKIFKRQLPSDVGFIDQQLYNQLTTNLQRYEYL